MRATRKQVTQKNAAFQKWMTRVDKEMMDLSYGMATSLDIADYMYYDAFEAGEDPREVAMEALLADDFPEEVWDEW